jgi:hypothetical protein
MALRNWGIRGLLVALVLVLAISPVSPAGAAINTRTVVCEAGGANFITGNGPYNWSFYGSGTCVGTVFGVQSVFLRGSGTSDTLGLCDGLLVQNLDLTVDLSMLNNRTLVTHNFTETWSSPLSTYPVATPFLIQDAADTFTGAGTIFDHIFLGCPPGGAPPTVYAWAQSLPF